MTYKVELDVYNGPMDLLLYLIKRQEVDIHDIEIARIADQYVGYLALLKDLDIELAGDFLVMAATLMELKSRSLLPRAPALEEGEDQVEAGGDPREILIRQLIEYRRFKEAAGLLSDRGSEMLRRFPRQLDEDLLKRLLGDEQAPEDEAPVQEFLAGVEIWDLFGAFSQVIKTLGYSKPREVVYDETPVEEAALALLARLEAEKSLLFTQLFDPAKGLGYAVTLFLALLELMRQRRVGAEQAADFKDIRLYLRDPQTETYTQRKPKGAAQSRDGLKRSHPRRPTSRQKEHLQEMMEDLQVEKTEFDEALDSIRVPEVEPFHPIYSDAELLGRDGTDIPVPRRAEDDSAGAAEGAGPAPPAATDAPPAGQAPAPDAAPPPPDEAGAQGPAETGDSAAPPEAPQGPTLTAPAADDQAPATEDEPPENPGPPH